MEEYKLRILPPAQIDILDIVEHLNTLSSEAAAHNYDQLIGQIFGLASAPERYPLARDTQLRLRGYRALVHNGYIVLFVIKPETVEIRRVLYTKRQYEWLFS